MDGMDWFRTVCAGSDNGNSSDFMKKARALVQLFSKSHAKTEELKEVQKKSSVHAPNDTPVSVLADVVTRWWSTHESICRLIHLKTALGTMVCKGKLDASRNLSEEEWTILEAVKVHCALSYAISSRTN